MFQEFGKCPECGSENVYFGDIYWNDDEIRPRIEQECVCEDCGCHFRELHETRYESAEVDQHGDKYEESEEEEEA